MICNPGTSPNCSNALKNAVQGHFEIVRMLLSKGAKPDTPNVLSAVAMKGHDEVIRLLLETGADLDISSALSNAATNGGICTADTAKD